MGYPSAEAFTEFAHEVESRLRYALSAELGYDRGREAAQDALVWAWEHWDALAATRNQPGYLYRVAKRRALKKPSPFPASVDGQHFDSQAVEPGLRTALAHLSPRQRTAVFLIEGLGMTYQQAAEYLGVSRSTVQTHLERGLIELRRQMGVRDAI